MACETPTAPRPPMRRLAALRAAALAALVLGGAVTPGAATGHSTAFAPKGEAVAAPKGARGLCAAHPWACAASETRSWNARALLTRARVVNARVNRAVTEISDKAQYGREEVWALPTARGGDCEDFALLKKRKLMTFGVEPARLMIATVLDRQGRSHAVLLLRTDEGDLVLDNLVDSILPWDKTGYTFLRVQDPEAPARWRRVFAGGMLADPPVAAASGAAASR